MATVKIKGLKELRTKFNRKVKIAINKVFRSKEIKQTVARIVINDIKNSIFRAASPATQRVREYLENYNITDKNYDRRLINITFTGDLLEDLYRNVKADTTNLAIILDHSDKIKKGYKTKNGRLKSKLTYKKLSDILISDKGLDYLSLSDKTTKKIQNYLIPKLEELIVKELNS